MFECYDNNGTLSSVLNGSVLTSGRSARSITPGTAEARGHCGVWVCGGGGGEYISSGYELMLPLKCFKTKFPSLPIRFITTIDSKYKTD